jgi:hypothetical protein
MVETHAALCQGPCRNSLRSPLLASVAEVAALYLRSQVRSDEGEAQRSKNTGELCITVPKVRLPVPAGKVFVPTARWVGPRAGVSRTIYVLAAAC